MKKTVNVNIGGFPFILDEDAFSSLKRYLNEIEIRLDGIENKEVLEDVETRIADIFNENLSDARVEVVGLPLVQRAISIIGSAREFGEPRRPVSVTAQEEAPRKIYRSRDSVIGGVCGGLATYLNADPTLVRIVMFLLIFLGGLSLWVYIIMWIVIPREPKSLEINENERRL